jgi:hypothetical protein
MAETTTIENISAGDARERVEQIYHTYLDCEYEVEYYGSIHARTVRYSRHFDFVIGLGAAISGGSGVIGAIQNSALGAWACGILTVATVILTAAKASYNWPAQVEMALYNLEFFRQMVRSYRLLVEDMRYAKRWETKFDQRHEKLRDDLTKRPKDTLPSLSDDERRAIQDGIKHRIQYKTWWKPGNDTETNAAG